MNPRRKRQRFCQDCRGPLGERPVARGEGWCCGFCASFPRTFGAETVVASQHLGRPDPDEEPTTPWNRREEQP